MSSNLRKNILIEIARYTGRRVKSSFIKNTKDIIPRIVRFHNLITGIYKPVWSEYALSIVMKLNSPYEHKDRVNFLEDGRWVMKYSPRSGGQEHSDNRALIKCMDDNVPLAVFMQLTDKRDRKYGSTYRVLGLGLINGYDAKDDVFIVASVDINSLEKLTSLIPEEETRHEVLLYSQITNEFRPFVKEDTASYTVNLPKRNRAFRNIILREYDFTCAVCEMKFRLNNLYETTAAHIVPKQLNGTDDPRNGLSLCRTHHWAFDVGLFSISDDYELLLSSSIGRAETKNFNLLHLKNKLIVLPLSLGFFPHQDALLWHRDKVLLK